MNPICFSEIIGNDHIKQQLSNMVSKKAIGHALLFAGPEGIGKSLFTWALAARIMSECDPLVQHASKIQKGQHPDIHIYRPEGKLGLHSIQSLRQLSEEVHLPPYESSWKFFIIHDAERMLSYSANALLKTFEEPPPHTVIILLSRSKSALLPTILSRCYTLHFQCLSNEQMYHFLKKRYPNEDSQLIKMVNQSQGSISRALRIASQGDKVRNDVLNILTKGQFHNYRQLQESIEHLCQYVEVLKKQAEEAAKEELYKGYTDHISSQQQSILEKEVEGLIALTLTQEAQAIFDVILSWYRDIHLLLLGGSPTLLANPDFESALEQAVQRNEFKSLEQVYQTIEEAHLSLQRSTPLALCLENVLLKLDCIK